MQVSSQTANREAAQAHPGEQQEKHREQDQAAAGECSLHPGDG